MFLIVISLSVTNSYSEVINNTDGNDTTQINKYIQSVEIMTNILLLESTLDTNSNYELTIIINKYMMLEMVYPNNNKEMQVFIIDKMTKYINIKSNLDKKNGEEWYYD